MGVSNRVNAGRELLNRISPKWEERVNVKHLTIQDETNEHLLAQIFGSYEVGKQIVCRSSGLSLQKLGFAPCAAKGTHGYKGETANLLQRWTALISALQEQPVH